jgi:hypothetical protein
MEATQIKTIDIHLKTRIENISDEKLSQDCLRILENANNGSPIISFRCSALEVVEIYELCDKLGIKRTSVIKGAIGKYKKSFKS